MHCVREQLEPSHYIKDDEDDMNIELEVENLRKQVEEIKLKLAKHSRGGGQDRPQRREILTRDTLKCNY